MNYSLVSSLYAQYRKANKPRLTYAYRELILEANNNHCAYCNKKVTISEMEADHVFPFHRGGKTTFNNMVCSCIKCNRSKGTKLWRVKYLHRPIHYNLLVVRYITDHFKWQHLL